MERNNLKKKRLPISIDRKLIFREFRTKALSKKEEKMVIKYGRQNYVEQNYVEQNYVEQNYVEQNYGRKKYQKDDKLNELYLTSHVLLEHRIY